MRKLLARIFRRKNKPTSAKSEVECWNWLISFYQ